MNFDFLSPVKLLLQENGIENHYDRDIKLINKRKSETYVLINIKKIYLTKNSKFINSIEYVPAITNSEENDDDLNIYYIIDSIDNINIINNLFKLNFNEFKIIEYSSRNQNLYDNKPRQDIIESLTLEFKLEELFNAIQSN